MLIKSRNQICSSLFCQCYRRHGNEVCIICENKSVVICIQCFQLFSVGFTFHSADSRCSFWTRLIQLGLARDLTAPNLEPVRTRLAKISYQSQWRMLFWIPFIILIAQYNAQYVTVDFGCMPICRYGWSQTNHRGIRQITPVVVIFWLENHMRHRANRLPVFDVRCTIDWPWRARVRQLIWDYFERRVIRSPNSQLSVILCVLVSDLKEEFKFVVLGLTENLMFRRLEECYDQYHDTLGALALVRQNEGAETGE